LAIIQHTENSFHRNAQKIQDTVNSYALDNYSLQIHLQLLVKTGNSTCAKMNSQTNMVVQGSVSEFQI